MIFYSIVQNLIYIDLLLICYKGLKYLRLNTYVWNIFGSLRNSCTKSLKKLGLIPTKEKCLSNNFIQKMQNNSMHRFYGKKIIIRFPFLKNSMISILSIQTFQIWEKFFISHFSRLISLTQKKTFMRAKFSNFCLLRSPRTVFIHYKNQRSDWRFSVIE